MVIIKLGGAYSVWDRQYVSILYELGYLLTLIFSSLSHVIT
jgi:hypothetical protein